MKETAMPEGTADLSYIANLDPYREAFLAAMDDDFNTPKAMATLHELARMVNRMLDSGQPINHGTLAAIDQMFSELGGQILGIIPDQLEPPEVRSGLVDGLMDLILSIRQEYRAAKDWARADAIRQRLAELGIIVEDRPEGPTWRLEM
jgi:cysteinyl-tRNA synthetase